MKGRAGLILGGKGACLGMNEEGGAGWVGGVGGKRLSKNREKDEREVGIKRGARTASALLAPIIRWNRLMFAESLFSRLFPLSPPIRDVSCVEYFIVEAVEQKRGALAGGSGILFFATATIEPADPTEKKKELTFWARQPSSVADIF